MLLIGSLLKLKVYMYKVNSWMLLQFSVHNFEDDAILFLDIKILSLFLHLTDQKVNIKKLIDLCFKYY